MAWTIDEILAATGGKIVHGRTKAVFGEVVTDSGKVKQNSIFLALKGERFDGHRFAPEAARRGAACVIAHRPLPALRGARVTIVRVPDTLRALGDLAHFRREKLAPTVVAITGSNGKTTTKEMVASILAPGAAGRRGLLKTEGNLNNLVGLPLTLLNLRKSHRVAVVELGTNRPGEIRRLAEIAAPDLGIITAVAAAHLEGLKNLAGVAREKGALFQNMRPGGAIAVNQDDPRVRRLGRKFKGRKIAYGKGAGVRAEAIRPDPPRGMRFTLRAGGGSCPVRLQYFGRHNVDNAVGAAALAAGLGLKLPAIRRGLEAAKPFAMRMQADSWRGVAIINDAYNANPASMIAAIDTLAGLGRSGAKIAVLGDMFELGDQSALQHRRLGRHVARAGIDRLYLLGRQAKAVAEGAIRGGMERERILVGRDHADIADRLKDRLRRGDWLLVKGSRGMRMEQVLEGLKS